MSEDLELAGIFNRTIAYILDTFLMMGISFVIGFIFGYITTLIGNTGLLQPIYLQIFGITLTLCYFIILEAKKGQTLGKKFIGIKVVKENGSDIGIITSVKRNLMRIVDYLPIFYIVGLAAIKLSDSNQRLGDMTAETLVVKE